MSLNVSFSSHKNYISAGLKHFTVWLDEITSASNQVVLEDVDLL